jgi:hypothetical protein
MKQVTSVTGLRDGARSRCQENYLGVAIRQHDNPYNSVPENYCQDGLHRDDRQSREERVKG